jgi:iron complex transport system ATP-binding protein
LKINQTSFLRVEEIGFSYGNRSVLRNVSFEAQPGVISGLLGPNGSGKTTLLKCINGLYAPTYGRIMINGQGIAGLSRKEIAAVMAMVPQQTVVAFSFSALQMVLMGRTPRFGNTKTPGPQDYDEAYDMLKDLGIAHLADRRFNELSGGEKQMVILARAFFQDTRTLLFDEPTSHLDFKNQVLIMEIIQEMTRKKDLISLVTLHDPNLAYRYCERVVMLKQGKVVCKGNREKAFDNHTLSSLYDMNVFIDHTKRGVVMALPEQWVAEKKGFR